MRRWLVLIALLTAVQADASTLDTSGKDIFDRPVAELVSHGLPTMVLYANKATKDTVQGPATQMAVRLHDVPFVTLVHIDLRDVPALFRGIARGKIRNSHRNGVERYVEAFRSLGFAPPDDAFNRLIFVSDNDGGPQQALGLNRGFSEALAIVYDGQGQEICRGPFPRDLDRIEQALRDASGRKRAAVR
jgi:hypothetical protein